MPFSTIYSGADGATWAERDRLLAVALTLYEESLHGRCGQPREIAFNPDADGWFKVDELTCHACAALDRHAVEQHGTEPVPGGVVGVRLEMPVGRKLRPLPPQ